MWRDATTPESDAESRDAAADLVSLPGMRQRGDPRQHGLAKSEEIVARPISGIAGIPSQHDRHIP